MERTRVARSRKPDVGVLSRVFVAALALPVGVFAVLDLQRGAWWDAAVLGALFLVAAWAGWRVIRFYARRSGPVSSHLPRSELHPKRRSGRVGP